MASEEEKTAIIDLVGKFNPIEWPWNNLVITKMRKEVTELSCSLDKGNSDNCVVKMMAIRELIINELIAVHGTQDYYDDRDGGKLTAILLSVDNFSLNQLKDTALNIRDLIESIDSETYLPFNLTLVERKIGDDNIVDDIWYLLTYLEDWCVAAGHSRWLDRSEE
jgi:hypothetical protein